MCKHCISVPETLPDMLDHVYKHCISVRETLPDMLDHVCTHCISVLCTVITVALEVDFVDCMIKRSAFFLDIMQRRVVFLYRPVPSSRVQKLLDP